MGLRSWLFGRSRPSASRGEGDQPAAPADEAAATGNQPQAPAPPAANWQELPAYLPVDPRDHIPACVIATAVASADRPGAELRVHSVKVGNEEYRRVACIATALAAATGTSSTYQVKRIYKLMDEEGSHAA